MDRLKKLGLDEKRIKQVEGNKSLRARLCLASDGLPAAPQKQHCTLAYNLATKAKSEEQVTAVLPFIISNGIQFESQVEAGLKFIQKCPDMPPASDVSAACGVGQIATDADITASVAETIANHRDQLVANRYRYNVGKILGDVRKMPSVAFCDTRKIKEAVDAQVLACLGPKTAADMAKPVKVKAAQRPVEKKEEIKEETYDSIEDLIRGSALKLHAPGGNQDSEGYVTTPKTEEIIAAHLKRTGGMVKTRFPPEPNGILHIGHAKAINFNFGYARAFNGTCNLRYDDTNPEKEEERFFRGIQEDIDWLGYKPTVVLHASDYFDQLYLWAVEMIHRGLAYVCHQQASDLKGHDSPDSPWRDRPMDESLGLFEDMKNGKFEEGEATLRIKHIMEDGKKDFVAYRIKYTHHVKSGDKWCIYPTYDFTHCLCDSIEDISHSLCTKEFQARRSSYYWLCNALDVYCPVQWEYGRLNLNYAVVSKRKIQALITDGCVAGWDDPRLFTLSALRRRGVPPAAVNLFCSRVGVTMSQVMLDPSNLDACAREVMNTTVDRTMGVLSPLRINITNMDKDKVDNISIPNLPGNDERGSHTVSFSNVVYIEEDDFSETTIKGYRRLTASQPVALKYANVVLTFTSRRPDGSLECTAAPLTDSNKPKAFIHWVSAASALDIKVSTFDKLFKSAAPEAAAGGYLKDLASNTKQVLSAKVDKYLFEPCMQNVQLERTSEISTVPKLSFQFERQGYYTVDRSDTKEHGMLYFNKTVGLKEDKQK